MGREDDEFERMRLVWRIEKDRKLIDDYRVNELFRIDKLLSSARRLGVLDERLGGVGDGYDA
ncbi:hypothetical protein C8E87_3861 [Paractinoplanes brasiliensis]|uniref:Uncharacterized protein n=1 Tax=Paractinoplanes brasiliensis TaxID=52695 RepID=A0A4R6JWB1_9ACTN|nr:hypothetical protein C8E87_3861 [Actinoplanes brasiliensis]GID25218.1 hypothetical protein Abr02nite_02010 [Actinoplanes brasiliensis]